MYPKLAKSRAIAREAEKVFEGLLSSSLWNDTKVPQDGDFGLDYRIEFASEGELRGCQFFVQLKGFETIADDSIRVRVKTTTLRYWQGQDLPVLLVAVDCAARKGYFRWIDKRMDVHKGKDTQTLLIRREDVLLDYKLILSLQTWYGQWSQDLIRKRIDRHYGQVFHDTMILSEGLRSALAALLFVPRNAVENIDEYREMHVSMFMTVLLKFQHDLRLFRASSALSPESANLNVERLFDNLEQRLDAILVSIPVEQTSPGWGAVLIDAAQFPRIVHEVGDLLTVTNLFFIKQFVGHAGVAQALKETPPESLEEDDQL